MASETDHRPLSPHLQVYRPQLTSVLSILHRMTGVALAFGAPVLVWWLAAVAVGPEYFDFVNGLLGHWLGRIALFGWSFALFFHLFNGIRHLFWDAGLGFELKTAYASGWLVVLAALAGTLIAWTAAYGLLGGPA